MRREQLPLTALPAWSKLNDVSFIDISVQELNDSKGSGLVTSRALSSKATYDIPTLLVVPHDLILSAEAIEEYAKVDQHFRELLEVAGGKSLRGDMLLFLLMQITIASLSHPQNVGVQNPWTEYCKILPSDIPVPTMWSEEGRFMLVGTSLESAVNAKMSAMGREFDKLREQTTGLQWCYKSWWEHETLPITDWILLDAWYRSRSLELPKAGESMVPCLDMANHSSVPNAYYEQTSNDSVALLLRPDFELSLTSEITISYGESKSEAEMLFSYGFIDESSTSKALVLPLEPFPDDPLGKAKLAAFAGKPVVRISADQDSVAWEGPFLYLMCLNEEDGLDFKVLQETDGSRSQLRVFWQESDVTDITDTFECLIGDHSLKDVFKLRAVALLHDRIRQQLGLLYASEETVQSLADLEHISPDFLKNAIKLRTSETELLQRAFAFVDMQKTQLLESDTVVRYLGSMNEEPTEVAETNDDDDFS
ncbi:SET domain-containing protein [Lachnellula hyalina]|uniref:SET domain-containing protein n=1 Tax=Lachnellula hyalina TaxID=1316788 RepID=A0A8H8U4J3_9HELO|nr:SET domain-containing protein [Lachnellula hyalina]TVY31195.1 SET domain-containing protein [Lachnellula hyalina]